MSEEITIETEKGLSVLKKNGTVLQCPFKSAIPLQNNLGSLQIVNVECNSNCVFWEAVQNPRDEKRMAVHLKCKEVQIQVTNPKKIELL